LSKIENAGRTTGVVVKELDKMTRLQSGALGRSKAEIFLITYFLGYSRCQFEPSEAAEIIVVANSCIHQCMGRKAVDSNELFIESFEIPLADRIGEEETGSSLRSDA
jgi:hypothetical protein